MYEDLPVGSQISPRLVASIPDKHLSVGSVWYLYLLYLVYSCIESRTPSGVEVIASRLQLLLYERKSGKVGGSIPPLALNTTMYLCHRPFHIDTRDKSWNNREQNTIVQ
eukprot:scaffold6634_cov158-Amphora_coffeaeformis.AAC.12